MKYFSLFSGIGGFELGIQQAYEINNEHALKCQESKQEKCSQGRVRSFTESELQLHPRNWSAPLCIGFSEIDKYATEIYQKHFPNHKNYGDITKINEKELPDFDLLVGGFPCQAFSIAGKRGGFEDTRGTLFFEIARIVREKQPRLLLLENVKGLLSHNKGKTFYTIISILDELGYDIQWQVLNSKNHGVPQNRERVFIIGHLRGTPRPEVFPFGESDEKNDLEIDILGHKDKYRRANQVFNPSGITETLSTCGGGGQHPCTLNEQEPFIRNPYNGKTSNKESGTLGTSCGTSTGKTAQHLYRDCTVRRLTPTECERLQGFPDGWTEGLSDTQRYKTLGNAVTVNVIRDLIKKIYE